MIIEGIIWLTDIVDKIETRHGVTAYEAESIFTGKPIFDKLVKSQKVPIFVIPANAGIQ